MDVSGGSARHAARIYTSQIGFSPSDRVFAVLGAARGAPGPNEFRIRRESDGATVYRGGDADRRFFGYSWHGNNELGQTYTLACDTWQPEPGVYRFVAGSEHSHPFRISPYIYDVRHTRPLYFFRVQRSGAAMEWEALDGARGWHGADHLDDARQGQPDDPGGDDPGLLQQPPVFPNDARVDTVGGWFDAGDYNKYMGNTPWAVYNLLLSYEEHSEYWDHVDLDADGLPDLLEEACWALDWMLKMMHADGSVFERVFNGYGAPFDGRPDLETDNVPGTADDRPLDTDRWADVTAKSSYAMALAYRVFRDIDEDRALRYLRMARRTWRWAADNRTVVRPRRYGGGLYFGDVEINLTLGAIELYLATGERRPYLEFAEQAVDYHLAEKDWLGVSSWEYHASLALQRYHDGIADVRRRALIVEQLAAATVDRVALQQHNPYRVNDEWLFDSVRGAGFGQNDLAVASAADAAWLYARTGDRSYRDYAVDEIQWVWGRNPFGECWVCTPLAARFPRIHHTRITAQHPLEGVVLPGATDRDGNGIPDYTDDGEWYYSEPTINQQAVYARALANMHFLSGGDARWRPLPENR